MILTGEKSAILDLYDDVYADHENIKFSSPGQGLGTLRLVDAKNRYTHAIARPTGDRARQLENLGTINNKTLPLIAAKLVVDKIWIDVRTLKSSRLNQRATMPSEVRRLAEAFNKGEGVVLTEDHSINVHPRLLNLDTTGEDEATADPRSVTNS